MALVSVVNQDELKQVCTDAYVNESFDVALIFAPGTVFSPTDSYATYMASECSQGLGGYARKSFTYGLGDIGDYQEGLKAVPMARKTVTFTHDNSSNILEWSHVALIRRSTTSIVACSQLTNAVELVEDQQAIYYYDLLFYGTTGSRE